MLKLFKEKKASINYRLIIIFLIVLAIIIGIVYIKSNSKHTLITSNNSIDDIINNYTSSDNPSFQNIDVELPFSREEKVDINETLQKFESNLLFTVKSMYTENYNSGKFNSKEKLLLAYWLSDLDESKYIRKDTEYGSMTYVDVEYMKELISNLFEEPADFSELTVIDNRVEISSDIGVGLFIPKINKLMYNEYTGIYSLYVDELDTYDTESYPEFVKPTFMDYLEDDIISKYILRYKTNLDESKTLISLEKEH